MNDKDMSLQNNSKDIQNRPRKERSWKKFQRNTYYHSSDKNGNKNNSISRQKGTSTKIFR
jgi:hypothetical protein